MTEDQVMRVMLSSAGSFSTLAARLHVWRDDDRCNAAARRFLRGATRGWVAPPFVGPHQAVESPSQVTTTRSRVWLSRPWRAGVETSVERRTPSQSVVHEHVLVINGGGWWEHDPASGLDSGTGHQDAELRLRYERVQDLVVPSIFAGFRSPRLAAARVVGGRDAYGLVLQPPVMESVPLPIDLGPLGFGDEYELSIDVERGVLLAIETRLEGSPLQRIELVAAVFDAPVEPQLFTAPSGEPMAPETRPRECTLRQAAELTGLELHVPSRLPPGARLNRGLFEAVAIPTPGLVVFGYTWEDRRAQEQVQITQSSNQGEPALPQSVPGTPQGLRWGNQVAYLVENLSSDGTPWYAVYLDAGATRVELHSVLDRNTTIDLAVSLTQQP